MSEIILHARGGDYKIEPPDSIDLNEVDDELFWKSKTCRVTYQLVEPHEWSEALHAAICKALHARFGIDKGAVNWKQNWPTDFVEVQGECRDITKQFVKAVAEAVIEGNYTDAWFDKQLESFEEQYIEEMD